MSYTETSNLLAIPNKDMETEKKTSTKFFYNIKDLIFRKKRKG